MFAKSIKLCCILHSQIQKHGAIKERKATRGGLSTPSSLQMKSLVVLSSPEVAVLVQMMVQRVWRPLAALKAKGER
ncbi:unnamed protein product [Ascophyllum nodosum]